MKRRVLRRFLIKCKQRLSQLTVFITLGFISLTIIHHYQQYKTTLAEQIQVATPKSGMIRQPFKHLTTPHENKPVLENGDFHFIIDNAYVEKDQLILEMTYHNLSSHPANPFDSFLFDFTQENDVAFFDLEMNSSATVDSSYQQMAPSNPRVKPNQSYPVYAVFDLMDLQDDVVISGRWIGSTVFKQTVHLKQLTNIRTASAKPGKKEEPSNGKTSCSIQDIPLK